MALALVSRNVGSAVMYDKMVKSWHTCFLIFLVIMHAAISYGGAFQQKFVARSRLTPEVIVPKDSRVQNKDGIYQRIVKRNEIQDSENTGTVNVGGYQGQRLTPEVIAPKGLAFYTIQGNFTAVAYPSENSGIDSNLGSFVLRFAKQNQAQSDVGPSQLGTPPENNIQQRSLPANFVQPRSAPENFVLQGSPHENYAQQRSSPEHFVEQGSPFGSYIQQRSPPGNHIQQRSPAANYSQQGSSPVQHGAQPVPSIQQEEQHCSVCHYAQAVAELLAEIDYFYHNKQLPKDSVLNLNEKILRKNFILRNPAVYRQYFNLVNTIGKITFNGFDQRLNKQTSGAHLDYSDPVIYKQLSDLLHGESSSNDFGLRFHEETKHQGVDSRNPLLYRQNSNLAICHLEVSHGSCKAAFTRFYYNPVSKQCESFVYGGCEGNTNNFLLKEECESFCIGAKTFSPKL